MSLDASSVSEGIKEELAKKRPDKYELILLCKQLQDCDGSIPEVTSLTFFLEALYQ